jgi:hypothetical protein
MSRLRVCLVYALLVLYAGAAHAYVRTTREGDGAAVAWRSAQIEFELATASIPQGMDPQHVRNAIASALQAWTEVAVPCTSVALRVVSSAEAAPSVARDGVNRMVFRRERWSKNGDPSPFLLYPPQQLAVTSVYVSRVEQSPKLASILEADIELNAVDFSWHEEQGTPRTNTGSDLGVIVRHEIGHALGLEHNCNDGSASGSGLEYCSKASPEVRSATMFPSWLEQNTDQRALGQDERHALCDIYPKLEQQPAANVNVDKAHSTTTSVNPTDARPVRVFIGLALTLLGLGTVLVHQRWLSR